MKNTCLEDQITGMEELSGGNFFCFLSVYQICFLDLFVLLPFSADKRELLNKTVALRKKLSLWKKQWLMPKQKWKNSQVTFFSFLVLPEVI